VFINTKERTRGHQLTGPHGFINANEGSWSINEAKFLNQCGGVRHYERGKLVKQ